MSIEVHIAIPYKSIDECDFSLPSFCVLTGINGSGKSHMLEIIEQGNTTPVPSLPFVQNKQIGQSKQPVNHILIDGKPCNKIKRISFGGLTPSVAAHAICP